MSLGGLVKAPFRLVEGVVDGAKNAVGGIFGSDSSRSSSSEHHYEHRSTYVDPAVTLAYQQRQLEMQQQELDRNRKYVDGKIKEGHRLHKEQDYAGAIVQFKSALDRDSKSVEAQEGLKRAYQTQGDQFFNEKRYFEAFSAYLSGETDNGLGRCVKEIRSKADTEESEADKLFAKEDFSGAIRKYQEIHSSLSRINKALSSSKKSSPGLQEDCQRIQKKIEQSTKKIQARGLIQEANKAVRASLAMQKQILSMSKSRADEFFSRVVRIEMSYKEANQLDSEASSSFSKEWNQLQGLLIQTKKRLDQLRVQELKQSVASAESSLQKLSLRQEKDLDQIVSQCADWIKFRDDLARHPSFNISKVDAKKETILEIQKQAQAAKKRLKDFPSSMIEALKSRIREYDAKGTFSEKQQNKLRDQIQLLLSKDDIFCNQFISLTEDGFSIFKKEMQGYLFKAINPPSSIKKCLGSHNFTFSRSFSISLANVQQCIDEAYKVGVIEDIQERLERSALSNAQKNLPFEQLPPPKNPHSSEQEFKDPEDEDLQKTVAFSAPALEESKQLEEEDMPS